METYTRHGDGGETGICGEVRLVKDEARMEAIGTVDELNTAIGFASAAVRTPVCGRAKRRVITLRRDKDHANPLTPPILMAGNPGPHGQN